MDKIRIDPCDWQQLQAMGSSLEALRNAARSEPDSEGKH